MRILYITSVIPYPPNNGIRVVPYHAMRLMAERGHEICLCCLTAEREDGIEGMTNEERFHGLRNMISPFSFWNKIKQNSKINRLFASIGIVPSFIRLYEDKEFRRKLEVILNKYNPDSIHFDFINTTNYIDCVPAGITTIASINDSIGFAMENRLRNESINGILRLGKNLQILQIRKFEKYNYPKFNCVHLMTELDADYLKKLNPTINTVVIPNGVEQTLFDLPLEGIKNKSVLFVGELRGNNLINIKRFAGKGWSKVRSIENLAILRLVGGLSTESLAWKDSVFHDDSIVFAGYVKALVDVYAGACIAVVPINKNSGIMNKIIEAMAAGILVVGYKLSFDGVKGAMDGVHYMTGETDEEIGEIVGRMLSNHEQRIKIGVMARKFALEHYSWSSRGDEYEKMYLNAC